MPHDDFFSNVPEKLIKLYHDKRDNCNALGRHLGVSPALVWKLLFRGIEPRDMTLRRKLFLKGKYRDPVPAWVIEATEILAKLEERAQPDPDRVYNRKGKRVK